MDLLSDNKLSGIKLEECGGTVNRIILGNFLPCFLVFQSTILPIIICLFNFLGTCTLLVYLLIVLGF